MGNPPKILQGFPYFTAFCVFLYNIQVMKCNLHDLDTMTKCMVFKTMPE